MAYSVINVDELEREGPGGAVRFVRRRLRVEAFGIGTVLRFDPGRLASRSPGRRG